MANQATYILIYIPVIKLQAMHSYWTLSMIPGSQGSNIDLRPVKGQEGQTYAYFIKFGSDSKLFGNWIMAKIFVEIFQKTYANTWYLKYINLKFTNFLHAKCQLGIYHINNAYKIWSNLVVGTHDVPCFLCMAKTSGMIDNIRWNNAIAETSIKNIIWNNYIFLFLFGVVGALMSTPRVPILET